MTGNPVIRVDGVSRCFGGVTALKNVSLDVGENEFLALLGASGCGKTTLLRMIAGLERPDSGRILLDGKDITADPPYMRPINMMFQSYALFPHMSVAANVGFGLKQEGVGGDELQTRVREALELVELGAFGDRKPHQMSGGQRQRVALARCLAKRPRVLLLDEPMAALDKHLRERTRLELAALRERLGITFIVVTHDQEEAMTMADRVAVMESGNIVQIDTPRDLYERPASRGVAGFFGDVNMWDGHVNFDGISVDCDATGIRVTVAAPLPEASAPVALALRPERISIGRTPVLNADNTVQGTVAEVVYLGTTSTYFVRLASGALVRVMRQNASGDSMLARGDAVHLCWPAAAAVVLTQ